MIRTSTPRRPRRVRSLARRDLEALESRTLMAVFTVNSFDDILNPPAGVVTLRSAIQAANNSLGADTIKITAPGTYRITTVGAATDNSAGELAITGADSLTIQNASGGVVTVDGGGLNRVFDISPRAVPKTPVTVTFVGLTITDGASALNTNGGGIDVEGRANLVLNGCDVTGNVAGLGGGGIAMDGDSTGTLTLSGTQVVRNVAENEGGGVAGFGTGSVTISGRSLVADNTAMGPQGGGGVAIDRPSLTVTGSTLSGNRAIVGPGGAIANLNASATSVTLSGSLIEGNFSARSGGGYADAGGSASLKVTDSFFLDNAAVGNGGGLSVAASTATIVNTTLAGNSAESGGGADFPGPGSDVLVEDCTISGNAAATSGGGLSVEAVNEFDALNSTFEGNSTLPFGFGGGIGATLVNGNFSVGNCLFLGNATTGNGGALGGSGGSWFVSDSRFTGNAAGNGGAVNGSPGALFIDDNTFDHNRASGNGGAMTLSVNGTSNGMDNDTIAFNTAGRFGGGLDLSAGSGSVALVDDTIDGNAAGTGGGVYQDINNTVNAIGTIFANNTAGGTASDYDLATGTLNSKGGNLVGNATGDGDAFGPSDVFGDPKLGPLVDNGGARAGAPGSSQIVPTQALLPGSPAFTTGAPGLTDDERGFNRPTTKPAIGAYQPQYAANATPNQIFVENTYEVLLNRVADPGGLTGGTAFLAAGGTPTGLVQLLQGTTEYLDDEVTLLYNRYLGRAPSASELPAVAAVMKGGATPEQIAASLLGTDEFFNDFGGNTDTFVEAAFVAALGRPTASLAERTAWDTVLAAGTARPTVATILLTTQEYLSDLVVADFDAYLGRGPSTADMNAFLASAKAGISSTNLAAIALGSSFAART